MVARLTRMTISFLSALIINICLLSPRVTAEGRSLYIRHAVAGKAIDKAYQDAGMSIDLIKLDLLEAQRQGREIPKKLLARIDETDKEMRSRWIILDKKQKVVMKELRSAPAKGNYQLSIQSLEDSPASEVGWFIWRSAKIVWPDGTTIDIPLKRFRNNLYFRKYSYLCEPSPVAGVYGLQSSINKSIAGFDASPLPAGNAKLVISGLDCEKPGITRIRITINKSEIFNGENPFRKKGWTDHSFTIPASAFTEKMTAESAKHHLLKDLSSLENSVEPFSKWVNKQAKQISKEAKEYLKQLVYKPQKQRSDDGWRKHFMRGMCFGYLKNYEHVAKSLKNIDTTLMYGYLTPDKYDSMDKELCKVGIPYVGVAWRRREKPAFILWDMQSYVNDEKFKEGVQFFFDAYGKGHKSYLGIAFDEPRIIDRNIKSLPKREYDKFVAAFKQYLEYRRPRLENTGIKWPDEIAQVFKAPSNNNLPLWMEWQMFKKKMMKDFFLKAQKYCGDRKRLFFPLINNQQPVKPQMASYLSAGAVPLVGTDLYNNGAIREGFSMHLLHTSAKGKAIMTPGSGYSCKSPDRFLRSLCTGMIHADGILQWVYVYTSKYRDPDYFWRTGGKKDDRDDRGRNPASHWRPEYWYIQKDVFSKAKKSEPYLVDAKSAAKTLQLYSERTAIAGSAKMSGIPSTIEYFDDQQGVYSDMVAQSRPLDLCFIEAMTPERLKQYKVAILTGSCIMTPEEVKMIRDWVNSGGVLIASGETSLYDEWGGKLNDYALADIFGCRYEKTAKGVGLFKWRDIQVKYDPKKNYVKVIVAPGTKVISKWKNGDPALIYRKTGKGQVWFLTMCRAGLRLERSKPNSALFGCGAVGIGKLIGELRNNVLKTSLVYVSDLPEGVEFQLRKTDNGDYVIHLLDWFDKRTINEAKLEINMLGRWEVLNPFTGKNIGTLSKGKKISVPPFHLYQIIVLKKEKRSN